MVVVKGLRHNHHTSSTATLCITTPPHVATTLLPLHGSPQRCASPHRHTSLQRCHPCMCRHNVVHHHTTTRRHNVVTFACVATTLCMTTPPHVATTLSPLPVSPQRCASPHRHTPPTLSQLHVSPRRCTSYDTRHTRASFECWVMCAMTRISHVTRSHVTCHTTHCTASAGEDDTRGADQ